MDVLFAIKTLNNAIGGAERVLAVVTSGLVERGHKVSILTYDPPGGQAFYPLHASVERVDLNLGNPERRARPVETMRRMIGLRRAVLARNPVVVIGFMQSMYIPLGIALAGTGLPLVASEHIVADHYRGRPIESVLLRLTPFLSRRITVISERIRKEFPVRLQRHMTVISNPIDAPSGGAADVAGAHSVRRTILSVGRLTAQKCQEDLVNAFAMLAEDFPEWDLRIVGKGELRARLEAQIASLKLEKRIELAGTTPLISEEYRRAQLFVLPSLYESFGLAAAEAMSHGLPVVAFADCPGINELVIDGENGILVNGGVRRADELARALRPLLNSSDLRERLGRSGPLSMASFSKEKICNQWEALLYECRRS
jgi:glycosyltransferase involved in cell wall biosynthesis